MAKQSYAVMGATGHVGSALAENLLQRGHEVRAIARSADKLAALRAKGAKVVPAAFDDAKALTAAFRGTSAIFSFLPPGYDAEDLGAYQDRVGEAIATAIRAAGVTRALDLSSLGADLPDGTGPIKGLHRHEKRLEAMASLDVLHLRPGYFMENLLWAIPAIKAHGLHPNALREDVPLPMVAARDVGAKAAELLDRLEFRGRTVFELEGPRRITMKDATAVIGEAIGKPDLRYAQIAFSDMEKAMLSTGMKPIAVRLMSEMVRAMNDGKVEPRQPATSERKGRTTIEEFVAQVFAVAYREG